MNHPTLPSVDRQPALGVSRTGCLRHVPKSPGTSGHRMPSGRFWCKHLLSPARAKRQADHRKAGFSRQMEIRRVKLLAQTSIIVCIALLLPGCGSSEKGTNAFDEISRLPSREELVEIEIGRFVVPIPLVLDDSAEKIEIDNLIQLDFKLVAVVLPKHEASVRHLMKRHAGKIRDEVMRVCRNTSRDDILESEWSTLKAHLLDAIQPLLGGTVVRRMAIPHKVIDPL